MVLGGFQFLMSEVLRLLGRLLYHQRERIFIELMTSDREGVQRGLEMKDLRDLNDLTIHGVKPISDE